MGIRELIGTGLELQPATFTLSILVV